MPTRGRPWAAMEAIASVMKHAAQPLRVQIILCLDIDDESRVGMTGQGVGSSFGYRKSFSERVNEAVKNAIDSPQIYTHVGWMADDVRYLTPNWDDIVRSHSELLVYGEDGIHNEGMATHPWVRIEVPRALGYLIPPELSHYCPDLFLGDLAKAVGSIAYDPRLKIEHLHPDAGKGQDDQTYRDAKLTWDSDHATWNSIQPQIPELAKRVAEFMKGRT